ncbi:MAG: hypothetical protein AB1758_19805, partial [Candidatus Eremiobacterota bacterium]
LRYKMETTSALVADAGIQYAIAYLEDRLERSLEPVPGTRTTLTLRSQDLRTDMNGWEWQVTVIPDEETPPVGTNPRRAYTLESRAVFSNKVYRVVTTSLVQESFVRYARFTDRWPDAIGVWAGAQHFTGPFHSNTDIRVGIHAGYYNDESEQLFQSTVTSVRGIVYQADTFEPPPSTPQQFRRLYDIPREPGTVDPVQVPWDSNMIRRNCYPGQDPTADGVHVNAPGGRVAGGIFMRGTVDELVLGVEGGNPTQTITINGKRYKVVELGDRDTGRTRVTDLSNGQVIVDAQGHPNGTLFATGDIKSLHGINKGRHTIAVDTLRHNKITLGGNVLQHNLGPDSPPRLMNNENALGLIAYELTIPRRLDPADGPLTLHAAVMAGDGNGNGGLKTEDLEGIERNNAHHNYFNITGSVVSDTLHMMAHIDSGVPGMGGSGWTTRVEFDPSLKDAPPPAYPSLPEFTMCGYSDSYGE